jgi:hypothetical protein
MATRPEDQNARTRFEAFQDGATLTELKSFITELEGLGIVCTVKRHPEINELIERNRR